LLDSLLQEILDCIFDENDVWNDITNDADKL